MFWFGADMTWRAVRTSQSGKVFRQALKKFKQDVTAMLFVHPISFDWLVNSCLGTKPY